MRYKGLQGVPVGERVRLVLFFLRQIQRVVVRARQNIFLVCDMRLELSCDSFGCAANFDDQKAKRAQAEPAVPQGRLYQG